MARNNFALPSPKEAGYGVSKDLDDVLSLIETCILIKTFEFKPRPNWNFHDLKPQIDAKIRPFGWTIYNDWRGGKEDGYTMWVLKPL